MSVALLVYVSILPKTDLAFILGLLVCIFSVAIMESTFELLFASMWCLIRQMKIKLGRIILAAI